MVLLLREVGLDFVGAAPVRHVFARETTAPPEAVYTALAEDVPGWTQWYGAVTLAQWTVAVDGTAPFRTSVRLARPGLSRAFRGAVASLDRRLAASGS